MDSSSPFGQQKSDQNAEGNDGAVKMEVNGAERQHSS